MDEFGILVESIGFRANGKSAPLADLKHKPKPKSHFAPHGAANTPPFHGSGSLPVDELDGIFRSNVTVSQQPHKSFGADDIFGGPVSSSNQYGGIDLESVLSGSANNRKNSSSSLNSMNSVGSYSFEDLLGLMEIKSKRSGSVDDLFGSGEVNMKQEKHGAGFDDLISGFGGASPSKTEVKSRMNGHPSNSSSTVIDDPFVVFESSAPQSANHWPFDVPMGNGVGKGSVQAEIDDFDDFIMGGVRRDQKVAGARNMPDKASFGTASNGFGNTDFVDEIFGGGGHAQQNNSARSSAMAENSSFDDFFPQKKVPEAKRAPSNASVSRKKVSVPASMGDDLTSLFGDITTSSVEFQEIDGEPEDRRKARLNRHMRTNARMAEALAEKNVRDLQNQRAQEEKHRLAQTLDDEIRRWATGKEGNLRALLSSLQQILGPECGWRPVSLTDMITSESVKRAYKKANLYVHPDKVQQKGADVREQYIAEKVFDLLKEAWNKFSAEELRIYWRIHKSTILT